ncbi:hypothetical protein MVLG_01436 [Microbotryum lychnidis-dioicae p1A1 Lamole]|uniref:MFS transporter, FHS family, L-fucose permease n=1 Tax=Microbotryum lychnidis-dioicae (strain p1A1 Lamole / MvSl-1064) TaxID=683840 RepID=U5H245_USTV1|nr:hypothetical protein MVLG_01436 [Microbotryum lychnidis-dioicae p1A1 Lamole]|eukprot:KDE08400.1 hypothetical protein MVLG_01436 [Microbotryum lychnidis-dioicae p1A1 Lamole]
MAGGGAVTGVKATGNVTKRQEYFAFSLVTSLFFLWGFSYGLLDVLNKHFQTFFGITKLQSTLLQVAYFGAYVVYSPVCGQFISKFGYKKGIYMGLSLYCIGALGFWPSAKFEKYGGFVASAFVIACGLATLEVCANSYVTVLGSPEQAAFRLNFSQSFNGLASFVGPLIASKYFFGDEATQHSLGNVQWVYLAGGKVGLASLFIVFFFESVCYPTTFTLATSNLGKWTKRGGSLVVMGVGGGAMFPPVQGAMADKTGTQLSYVIPFIGFLFVFAYGLGMRWYTAKFEQQLLNAEAEAGVPTLNRTESEKASVDEVEKF